MSVALTWLRDYPAQEQRLVARNYAKQLVERYRPVIGDALADGLLNSRQETQEGINATRELIAELKAKLNRTRASGVLHAGSVGTAEARDLLGVADALV